MNQRKSFYRKVTYGIIIAVLLFPLFRLSAPETLESPGGTLAQLRDEYNLSQSNLGEIDPSSETLKLATLGLRGVATSLLWDRAMHFKKVEDWNNLKVTLEQLAKLQPNYITFWKYQSWNLSYNVSVEFDDYHDRYYWVREGIRFLQDGNKYNQFNPILLWELGWINGQKIGRSDETEQFRRLYKEDDEFHPEDRTPANRDNWQVAKLRYNESIASVEEKGNSFGKKSPSIYYSSPSKAQMNYSEAITKEALFERAIGAWKLAADEWYDYGNILLEHSTGMLLRFNELDEVMKEIEEKQLELKGLFDGVEEKATAQAKATLSQEQLDALEIPKKDRTSKQEELAYQAERALKITPQKLAEIIKEDNPENERIAARLVSEINELDRRGRYITAYRETTNFDYWKLRCEFEQDPDTVKAHELIYRAKKAFDDEADPILAKELYEEGFQHWASVFERFPDLIDPDKGGITPDDVMYEIYDYKKAIEQLDEEIADDFPLWNVIEQYDSEGVFRLETAKRAQRKLDKQALKLEEQKKEESEPESEESSSEE